MCSAANLKGDLLFDLMQHRGLLSSDNPFKKAIAAHFCADFGHCKDDSYNFAVFVYTTHIFISLFSFYVTDAGTLRTELSLPILDSHRAHRKETHPKWTNKGILAYSKMTGSFTYTNLVYNSFLFLSFLPSFICSLLPSLKP